MLASASPSRLRLLKMAGIEPVVQVSDVDEEALAKTQGGASLDSAELAVLLARAKAADVAYGLAPGPIVIGADSVLEWNDQSLGKPLTSAAAIERLRQMQGTSGVLHTGQCVIDTQTGQSDAQVASTRVDFSPMSDAEIKAYVATGEPLNVAGSFTLDGLSAPFIDGVDGDPSNVIGLSLPLLRRQLVLLGISWLTVVSY